MSKGYKKNFVLLENLERLIAQLKYFVCVFIFGTHLSIVNLSVKAVHLGLQIRIRKAETQPYKTKKVKKK